MQEVSLHIEATTRCTLECPGCARTFLLNKFGKKSLLIQDIDETTLDSFVDISVDNIVLSGVHGDPIYHPRFHKLIKVLKTKSNSITIVTNGSHRTKKWWEKTADLLDNKDEVKFSIDGTEKNFNQYRINGDWDSILVGINACVKSQAKTSWKYIPFSFNESCIEEAKETAYKLGIDNFFLYRSNRWEELGHLKPTDSSLINTEYARKDSYSKKDFPIDPICKNNSEHYISASGYYSPCCFVADPRFYYKSKWWKNKTEHKINSSELSTQIKLFKRFYAKINDTAPEYCLFNCGKC